jgi:hypothetical protein
MKETINGHSTEQRKVYLATVIGVLFLCSIPKVVCPIVTTPLLMRGFPCLIRL